MALYRPLSNAEQLGDLFVRMPFDDKRQDLAFARCQARQARQPCIGPGDRQVCHRFAELRDPGPILQRVSAGSDLTQEGMLLS